MHYHAACRDAITRFDERDALMHHSFWYIVSLVLGWFDTVENIFLAVKDFELNYFFQIISIWNTVSKVPTSLSFTFFNFRNADFWLVSCDFQNILNN